jgi:hypothetical protein
MDNLDIKAPIFEEAILDGAYSKNKMVEMINKIINPESLSESDETVLGSVLFSINDSGLKNLNLIQLINKIELNKTNAAKSLVAKIHSNQNINNQMVKYKDEKRKENRKWYWGLILSVGFVALLIAFKFNYLKFPVTSAKEGAKVVVLDTARLAYSATAPYMNAQISPDQAQKISIQYRDNLQREIKKYVDNGYIIIHRSNVYVTAESNDITDTLIKNLGLKPVGREQFDADYTNEQKYNVLKNFAQLNLSNYEGAALEDANKQFNDQAEQQLNNAQVITNDEGQSIDLE